MEESMNTRLNYYVMNSNALMNVMQCLIGKCKTRPVTGTGQLAHHMKNFNVTLFANATAAAAARE